MIRDMRTLVVLILALAIPGNAVPVNQKGGAANAVPVQPDQSGGGSTHLATASTTPGDERVWDQAGNEYSTMAEFVQTHVAEAQDGAAEATINREEEGGGAATILWEKSATDRMNKEFEKLHYEEYKAHKAWMETLDHEHKGKQVGINLIQQPGGGSCPAGSNNDFVYSVTDSEQWTIPTVWHVMHNGNTGKVSQACIEAQLQQTNSHFAGVNIKFTLQNVEYVDNAQYHDDKDQNTYRTKYEVTPDQVINIWVNTADGYLGYAFYPTSSAKDRGMWMNYAVIGNCATLSRYNEGKTFTHELGHYLGLAHTFSNGCDSGHCSSSGDMMCDTGTEQEAHYGCAPRTTCGTPDPMDNYMDYSDDRCMDKFTAQQIRRMRCSIASFRSNLATTTGATTSGGNGGSSCADSTSWKDKWGDGCSWYATNDPGCKKYSDYGQKANCKLSCGVCQPTCADSTSWKDTWGDGCRWYAANDPGCKKYMDYGQKANCKVVCGSC